MTYKLSIGPNSKAFRAVEGKFIFEIDASSPIRLFSLESDMSDLLQLPRRTEPLDVNVHLVVVNSNTRELMTQAINSRRVDFIVDEAASKEEWIKIISRAAELNEKKKSQFNDLEKIKKQNRELETMSQGLEDLVENRTQSELNSKREVEDKVGQLRDLLRFVQSLSAANTPEEVLQALRREQKAYHRVSEPILVFSLSSGEKRVIYFRSGQLFEKQIQTKWPTGIRIRKNESLDSQYLADEFGRPFSKVLAVPLIARKSSQDALHPTLFFEHQLKSYEIESFLDFIGNRLQVVSLALDRLLLELDLRSATYLWEHTFDGLEDPVLIVDTDYGLLRSNRAFQEKRANDCYRAFSGYQEPCRGCPLHIALKSGAPARGLVRRNNSMYAVHSYPITFAKNENSTTVVNHYLNVTEAMALQEKVLQSEKMVALGHLAGHIAHELNNPLTGIRSLAQFWIEQSQHQIAEPVKSDFKEIELAAERSQSIITNLLQFASAEDPDQIVDVDLVKTVKQTIPFIKTALSIHRFEFVMPEGEVWVRAQPQLLQQVLFNLLKNASQAMSEPGDIVLKIQEQSINSLSQWQVTLTDSGVGMSPEQQKQIFTPFFTTKSEGQGTGLGLSLSQTIIKRFGGEISVYSELGKGTTFEILLPKVSSR